MILIVPMVVAIGSQYLIQRHGMLVRLKKGTNLYKMGRSLDQVNTHMTSKGVAKGGRGLVDIKTKNKAIDIMWLKSFLDYCLNQPLEALADAPLAIEVKGEIEETNMLKTSKAQGTE